MFETEVQRQLGGTFYGKFEAKWTNRSKILHLGLSRHLKNELTCLAILSPSDYPIGYVRQSNHQLIMWTCLVVLDFLIHLWGNYARL